MADVDSDRVASGVADQLALLPVRRFLDAAGDGNPATTAAGGEASAGARLPLR